MSVPDARVTVVMPVFNASRWLPETLASLAAQTYPHWELLAVDDGSTDDSPWIVAAFALDHPGQVRLVSIPNGGPSGARNAGISRAEGGLVAFLDADDLWEPGKLADQVAWLRDHPDAIGCTCPYSVFGSDAPESTRIVSFAWDQASLERWALLEGTGPGLCSTLMVRREALERIDGFDERLSNAEDTEFALRLLGTGAIGSIRDVGMHYRVSDTQNHLDLDAIDVGMSRLLDATPLGADPALRRRAMTNLRTFQALKTMEIGSRSRGAALLTRSFLAHPVGTARYLWLTAKRKVHPA